MIVAQVKVFFPIVSTRIFMKKSVPRRSQERNEKILHGFYEMVIDIFLFTNVKQIGMNGINVNDVYGH